MEQDFADAEDMDEGIEEVHGDDDSFSGYDFPESLDIELDIGLTF